MYVRREPAGFKTCSVAGGGSEARSAKLMLVPRRMWSRNCRSTSLRKSWKVQGCAACCAACCGVRAGGGRRSLAALGVGSKLTPCCACSHQASSRKHVLWVDEERSRKWMTGMAQHAL